MTVAAHRGGPLPYPENSLSAMSYSFANGADAAEIDLRLSRDNIPFAIHDDTLLRIFGINKKVSDVDSSILFSLGGPDGNYPLSVHSAAEFCVDRGKTILIHIKEDIQDAVSSLEGISGNHNSVIWGVSSMDLVPVIRGLVSRSRFLVFVENEEEIEKWLLEDVEIIRLWENWITGELIDRINSAGKKVWIMSGEASLNPGEIIDRGKLEFFADKLDGIIVNDPVSAMDLQKDIL